MRKAIIAYNGYDSGLGNRVRVVLGARVLAGMTDRAFRFVWPTGRLFGPRIDQLWEFRGATVPRALSRVLARKFPYYDEKLACLDDSHRGEWLWQIRTGSPLQLPASAPAWQDEFRALRPVPEIAERVGTVFDDHLRGAPYVGVMIRAHAVSHAKTREMSPLDWYLKRMREVREAYPQVRFYLSCDVDEVTERVSREIGGCFFLTDKGGYNSIPGVRSAVVDLYLLACSSYILGPHWSSFVHLAEYLSGDKLVMETAATGPAEPLQLDRPGLVADPLRPFARS